MVLSSLGTARVSGPGHHPRVTHKINLYHNLSPPAPAANAASSKPGCSSQTKHRYGNLPPLPASHRTPQAPLVQQTHRFHPQQRLVSKKAALVPAAVRAAVAEGPRAQPLPPQLSQNRPGAGSHLTPQHQLSPRGTGRPKSARRGAGMGFSSAVRTHVHTHTRLPVQPERWYPDTREMKK